MSIPIGDLIKPLPTYATVRNKSVNDLWEANQEEMCGICALCQERVALNKLDAMCERLKAIELSKARTRNAIRPRERLLDAAYDLFAANGIGQVGIDRILAKSGCAKASLYSNFASKNDLAIAFLDKREAQWTHAWLEAEIRGRSSNPTGRLLAMFDAFNGWFRRKDFEGCSFIKALLESTTGNPVHQAAANHLSNLRAIIRDLAEEANLRQPEKFAQAWQMLMKGSIISAWEGNRNAARDAKCAARLVLDGWKRRQA
jgi:AcrR family transcriptional regulator